MKKTLLALAVVASIATGRAASVDWQVNGTAATSGYTVYLLTSISDSYDNVAALAAASLDSATIAKNGRSYNTGARTVTDAAVTSSSTFYYAIVSGDAATSFNYVSASLGSYVYDTTADPPEATPGTFTSVNAAAILAGTSANFVPEPTSGLLMLLGLAGLALKRKRA